MPLSCFYQAGWPHWPFNARCAHSGRTRLSLWRWPCPRAWRWTKALSGRHVRAIQSHTLQRAQLGRRPPAQLGGGGGGGNSGGGGGTTQEVPQALPVPLLTCRGGVWTGQTGLSGLLSPAPPFSLRMEPGAGRYCLRAGRARGPGQMPRRWMITGTY